MQVNSMAKRAKKNSGTAGLPPGTLVYVGKERAEKVNITVIDYDEHDFQEREVERVEDCFQFRDSATVTWINIVGLRRVDIIEKIGEHFNFHPLLQEDILNTAQRPKMEDFDDHLSIILKKLRYDEKKKEVTAEQMSMVLGKNFVISFQEQKGDVFDPIRERIRAKKGRIRSMGADYLAYALLDAVVDNYFIIFENIGDRIDNMEKKVIEDPVPETPRTILRIKRNMIFLRKSIWPLREILSGLERAESPLIQESTGPYLRDVYDHTIQVIETLETFRDMLSGLSDLYLSSISNKMNEVMKVLTMIATIFIPLGFLAGLYGMNFEHMPELGWHGSYFVLLGIMAFTAIGMLLYFKWKDWL